MNPDDRDTPPHMPADPPAPEPNLAPAPNPVPEPAPNQNIQDAIAQLVQLMAMQFQAAQPQDNALLDTPACPQRPRVKMRDPDPYDGVDPSKLRSFLSQCRLTFRSRPHDFADDQVKITYAVSWLKGTALRWYEPNLNLHEDDLPDHALYWDAFEEALKATFGEPDPVTSATTKLDNLVMKDHHHIARYNVALTGYNDQVLYTRYYKGLAPRLKDALVYSGKPANFNGLRTRAQALDLRYWEHKDEDRPRAMSSGTSAATSSTHVPRNNNSQSRTPSRASTPGASTSKVKKPDLSNVLGSDGKLLPEEKERHKKNNLCLICASKDHYSDKCPSRKTPTKARAAVLETISDDKEQSRNSASEAESSESPN